MPTGQPREGWAGSAHPNHDTHRTVTRITYRGEPNSYGSRCPTARSETALSDVQRRHAMHNRDNIDVSSIELTEQDLSAVSAGKKSDTTALMQAISDAMKKIQDAAQSAISNIR